MALLSVRWLLLLVFEDLLGDLLQHLPGDHAADETEGGATDHPGQAGAVRLLVLVTAAVEQVGVGQDGRLEPRVDVLRSVGGGVGVRHL